MDSNKKKHDGNISTCMPECFGNLAKVFPMAENGLRQTPDECMYSCVHKTACLKKAMSGAGGGNVRNEIIKRGEKAGMIGFFERWSRKKQISRQKCD